MLALEIISSMLLIWLFSVFTSDSDFKSLTRTMTPPLVFSKAVKHARNTSSLVSELSHNKVLSWNSNMYSANDKSESRTMYLFISVTAIGSVFDFNNGLDSVSSCYKK